MVGCSDDTHRITSPATSQAHPDPLSTSFDDLSGQSGGVVDDGYFYDPWNMDVTGDEEIAPSDNPAGGSDSDDDVSDKPTDRGTY
jgi:hypothetical protein